MAKKIVSMSRLELLQRGVWVTAAGEHINVRNLEEGHLKNCMEYLQTRARTSWGAGLVTDAENTEQMLELLVREQVRRERLAAKRVRSERERGELQSKQAIVSREQMEKLGAAFSREFYHGVGTSSGDVGIPHQLADQQGRMEETRNWFTGELITQYSVSPGVYRHYKGDYYYVLGIAVDRHPVGTHPGSLPREYVIYYNGRHELQMREASDFLSEVELRDVAPGIPGRKTVPRFQSIPPRNH